MTDDDGPGRVLHIAVAVVAGILLVAAPGWPVKTATALWVLAYAGTCRWWGERRWLRPVLAVVTIVFCGVAFLQAGWSVQFFVGFPLLWVATDTFLAGLLWNLPMAAVVAFGVRTLELEGGGVAGEAALTGVAVGTGALLFSSFIAAWITQVDRLSEQRRVLLQELGAARDELAVSEHRRGVTEERARLAADIHDTLAQGFTSITMLVAAARSPDADVSSRLDQIDHAAREGLRSARRLIAGSQENMDLPDSLRRLFDDLAARSAITGEVRTEAWSTAGMRLDVVLLRAAQETLHNIEKHADARHATVRLGRSKGLAWMEVADDGIGFDTETSAGFGLAAMRRRVEREGGKLLIRSRPGATRIRAELPVEEP